MLYFQEYLAHSLQYIKLTVYYTNLVIMKYGEKMALRFYFGGSFVHFICLLCIICALCAPLRYLTKRGLGSRVKLPMEDVTVNIESIEKII